MPSVRTLICLAVLLALGACDGGPRGVSIKGKVTLDDEPVASGTINFIAKEGKATNVSSSIKNGVYEFSPKDGPAPGNYAVEIHWPKKTGKKIRVDAGIEGDELKEAVPAKYFGKETTLVAQVTTAAANVNFALKSK